jgi:hypothetical protein
VYRLNNEECLGQIIKKYGKYCSQECPWARVCVLIEMCMYLLQEQTMPPPHDSIDTEGNPRHS